MKIVLTNNDNIEVSLTCRHSWFLFTTSHSSRLEVNESLPLFEGASHTLRNHFCFYRLN